MELIKEGDLPTNIEFFRLDNTKATQPIITAIAEDGVMIFYELLGQSQIGDIPTVYMNGKQKYRRLMIQQVYPSIKQENEQITHKPQ